MTPDPAVIAASLDFMEHAWLSDDLLSDNVSPDGSLASGLVRSLTEKGVYAPHGDDSYTITPLGRAVAAAIRAQAVADVGAGEDA